MNFVYRAYGFNILSDIAIDFLIPIDIQAPIDVSVNFRPNVTTYSQLKSLPWKHVYPRLDAPNPGIEVHECAGQLKLLFRRDPDSALEFVVSKDTKNIILLRPSQIPEIDAISFFIGPICGVLNRLQSKTCLHASVLTLNGRAFALTGQKRAGKSTTSAMLTKRGAMLVADDIAVLSNSDGQFWVQPAYPFMRLSSPAIELTGRSMEETYELLSIGDKRYVPMQTTNNDSFPLKPQPLDAIYILSHRQAEDTNINVEQLDRNYGARILNANGYGRYIMDDAMRRQDFSFFAKFAREKHSRAIRRPNDLSRLTELADIILDDFRIIHDR